MRSTLPLCLPMVVASWPPLAMTNSPRGASRRVLGNSRLSAVCANAFAGVENAGEVQRIHRGDGDPFAALLLRGLAQRRRGFGQGELLARKSADEAACIRNFFSFLFPDVG